MLVGRLLYLSFKGKVCIFVKISFFLPLVLFRHASLLRFYTHTHTHTLLLHPPYYFYTHTHAYYFYTHPYYFYSAVCNILRVIIESLQIVRSGATGCKTVILHKLLCLLDFISNHPLHWCPGRSKDILHVGQPYNNNYMCDNPITTTTSVSTLQQQSHVC